MKTLDEIIIVIVNIAFVVIVAGNTWQVINRENALRACRIDYNVSSCAILIVPNTAKDTINKYTSKGKPL